MSSSNEVDALLATIQAKYRCTARHLESIPVKESSGVRTVWEGTVELFELAGGGAHKHCFAWIENFGQQHHLITVLRKGLVISPERAVKAWLASKPVTIHPVLKQQTPHPDGHRDRA